MRRKLRSAKKAVKAGAIGNESDSDSDSSASTSSDDSDSDNGDKELKVTDSLCLAVSYQ